MLRTLSVLCMGTDHLERVQFLPDARVCETRVNLMERNFLEKGHSRRRRNGEANQGYT